MAQNFTAGADLKVPLDVAGALWILGSGRSVEIVAGLAPGWLLLRYSLRHVHNIFASKALEYPPLGPVFFCSLHATPPHSAREERMLQGIFSRCDTDRSARLDKKELAEVTARNPQNIHPATFDFI